MRKLTKKLVTILLAICLIIPFSATTSFAAPNSQTAPDESLTATFISLTNGQATIHVKYDFSKVDALASTGPTAVFLSLKWTADGTALSSSDVTVSNITIDNAAADLTTSGCYVDRHTSTVDLSKSDGMAFAAGQLEFDLSFAVSDGASSIYLDNATTTNPKRYADGVFWGNSIYFALPSPIEVPLSSGILPPKGKAGLAYTGENQIGLAAGDGYTLSIPSDADPKATIDASGNAVATNSGTYEVTAALKNSDATWTDGTTEDKTISFTIAPASVTVPEGKNVTCKEGDNCIGVSHGDGYTLSAASGSGVTINSDGDAVVKDFNEDKATTYSVTASLADNSGNYAWPDGTTADKTVFFTVTPETKYTVTVYVNSDQYSDNSWNPIKAYAGDQIDVCADSGMPFSGYSKKGYTFAYWKYNRNGGDVASRSSSIEMPSSNLTVFTAWLQDPILASQSLADADYTKGAQASELSVTLADMTDLNCYSSDTTYQWYRSGTAIEGATEASYTPPTDTVGTNYYYCKITRNASFSGDVIASSEMVSDKARIAVSNEEITESSVDPIESQTYTGEAVTPAVVVKNAAGTALILDEDYTVEYSNNTKVGVAKAVIKGKGNYEGTATVYFAINKASADKITVADVDPTPVYNGEPQTPELIVKGNGKDLTKNFDYTVYFMNNTDAGIATAVVIGIGNYEGSIVKTFTIGKADSSVTAAPAAKKPVYNGEAQALAAAGKAEGGTMVYSLTENGTYTGNIPTAKNAGSYQVFYKVVGDSNHNDSKASNFTVKISQGSQALKVSTVKKTVKYKTVKKKAVNMSKVAVKGAKTKYTYKKVSGSKKLTISKSTGKIKVKKGTKKGTYKIKVKVTAQKSANYRAAVKTTTIKVRVK